MAGSKEEKQGYVLITNNVLRRCGSEKVSEKG